MPQPPNLNKMLEQAQAMLAQQQEAQEKLKSQTVEATAGGGMVRVVLTGDMRVQTLAIDPDAVDPEDVEMLQDMVIAALNEALRSAEELQQKAMGGAGDAGGFDPMSALDMLGGLGGGGGHGRRCPAACPAALRTARRGAASASPCSPRRSSAWSPSWASCPASATAPRSGWRSTSCAPRPRTPTRSRTRSAT